MKTLSFFHQIRKTFYTFYIGLEGFIIPIAMLSLYRIKHKYYSFFLLFVVSVVSVVVVAQSVIDINRSMSYVLLVLIMVVLLFNKLFTKETVFSIVAWGVVVNILYDEYYPFLAQLYRMKFITHSI